MGYKKGSPITTAKFMQSLGQKAFGQLEILAKEKGISVQQLIRAIVIPEWFENKRMKDRLLKRKMRERREA